MKCVELENIMLKDTLESSTLAGAKFPTRESSRLGVVRIATALGT